MKGLLLGDLPSLDFGKVKGHRPVAECFRVEVLGIPTNEDGHIVALGPTLVEVITQLKVTIRRGEILCETLISVAHEVMTCDEGLKDDNPT